MNAVGVFTCYNELSVDPEHLPRMVKSLRVLCPVVIGYDDGSTDGTQDLLVDLCDQVIRSERNEWQLETQHRQKLLDAALAQHPQWIIWLDCDEEFSEGCYAKIEEQEDNTDITGIRVKEMNLWRSRNHFRIDSKFESGWFVRCWRNTGTLRYRRYPPGLHQPPFPVGADCHVINLPPTSCRVIHYAWDTKDKIDAKLKRYAAAKRYDTANHSKNMRRMTDGPMVRLAPVPLSITREGGAR